MTSRQRAASRGTARGRRAAGAGTTSIQSRPVMSKTTTTIRTMPPTLDGPHRQSCQPQIRQAAEDEEQQDDEEQEAHRSEHVDQRAHVLEPVEARRQRLDHAGVPSSKADQCLPDGRPEHAPRLLNGHHVHAAAVGERDGRRRMHEPVHIQPEARVRAVGPGTSVPVMVAELAL